MSIEASADIPPNLDPDASLLEAIVANVRPLGNYRTGSISNRWLARSVVSLGFVGLLLVTSCGWVPSMKVGCPPVPTIDSNGSTPVKSALVVGSTQETSPRSGVLNIGSGVFDIRAASYLDDLLTEINRLRACAGNSPVIYAGLEANRAVGQYLADLTPLMVSMDSCFHGNGNPVRPAWDYVKSTGFGGGALGEVLACPGKNGYWTAPKIADGWWHSPTHWRSLFGDARVNAIACGTFGPQDGGRAYQTIACVTYRI